MLRAAFRSFRTQWRRKRLLAPWLALAERGRKLPPEGLAELRPFAHQVRGAADRILALSDLGAPACPDPLRNPGEDAVWRPGPWTDRMHPAGIAAPTSGLALGRGVTLFHDGQPSSIILRQRRSDNTTDAAAFSLGIEVFALDGSFLSMCIDLQDNLLAGLSRCHILRMTMDLECERPQDFYARLNLGQGPNTEDLVLHLPGIAGPCEVEFDLARMSIRGNRVDRAWIDVILQEPDHNAVVIRDLVLGRRPRAEL
jgi:hypothetical protein